MNAGNSTDHVLDQILDKSRTALAGSFNVLSTGEKLAAALVLNRPAWLEKMDYTMAEAIERVGADWLARIPEAARVIAHEAEMGRVMSEWDSAVKQEEKERSASSKPPRNRDHDIGF